MSAPTKEEMLENIEIAINALMTGGAVQSYSIGGRSVQKIPLSELQRMRKDLKDEIAARKDRTTYVRLDNPQ